MTKLKNLALIVLALLLTTAMGCSKKSDEGTVSEMAGTWRLTQILVNMDGNQLTSISTSGFQATFDDTAFTYTDEGQQSGTWLVNEDETELQVTYGSTSSNFVITTKTDTQISFTVRTIDLTGTLDDAEIALSRLINQQLNQSGTDWATATSGGQSINIIFTIVKS